MASLARKPKRRKPNKPSRTWPLFFHSNGQIAKKIRGRLHYFGRWNDPQGALKRYEQQREALEAGRIPRVVTEPDSITLRQLCNEFMASNERKSRMDKIVRSTFVDYMATCRRLLEALGKDRPVTDLAADDFSHLREAVSKNWGPVTLSNEIQRIRVLFRFGFESGLLDRPVRFGPGFKRPPKRAIRQARQAAGSRMFDRAEIIALLEAASTELRAMILLGCNCGFGNSDCRTVPLSAFDASLEWVEFPRPKTAIARRARLWTETSDALREVLVRRREPKYPADSHQVFITKYGKRWGNGTNACPISAEFRKLCLAGGVHKNGRGFYSLRRVFRTVADECRDAPAIDLVMGHQTEGMGAVYVQGIADDRLEAVANHVHKWLFSKDG